MISGVWPTLQQNGPHFVNTFMFEMFAIMCLTSWPDDTMTSVVNCTTYYEDPPKIYRTVDECNLASYIKLEETISGFYEMRVDFKSIQVGCNKING